VLVGS